jgi:hypothetical protein
MKSGFATLLLHFSKLPHSQSMEDILELLSLYSLIFTLHTFIMPTPEEEEIPDKKKQDKIQTVIRLMEAQELSPKKVEQVVEPVVKSRIRKRVTFSRD